VKTSVIVSTYNWPSAIEACLTSLRFQTSSNFEVIVADDGSGKETQELIRHYQTLMPNLIYSWQEDRGYRLSRSRNLAFTKSSGKQLIFLDGDCICPPNFVRNHQKLSQKGHVTAGNRKLLNTKQTSNWLRNPALFLDHFSSVKSSLKLKTLPLGLLRDVQPQNHLKVRGCNIGIQRADFMKLNGFDESYEGWGKEDSDFALRGINAGFSIRLGQFATTVLHLHHNEASRDNLEENLKRLNDLKISKRIKPLKSLLIEN